MARGIKTGGRKKGSTNKSTALIRERTAKAIESLEEGLTPLEVMIDNMRFAHGAAEAILRRLVDEGAKMPEGFNEFSQLLRFREIAQGAARDAARYVHPTIAAVDQRTGETAVTLESLIMAAVQKRNGIA